MRNPWRALMAVLAMAAVLDGAAAQTFPAGPVRVIVPYAAIVGNAAEFDTFVKADTERWGRVIKAAGIKAE